MYHGKIGRWFNVLLRNFFHMGNPRVVSCYCGSQFKLFPITYNDASLANTEYFLKLPIFITKYSSCFKVVIVPSYVRDRNADF